MKQERLAFVLMPFDGSFTDIYEQLIRKPFESAGFKVLRADDFENQQSILREIVVSISEADVIVADLTDSNPNVYYELGLAHALRRPVVLLTQDINSLPFDLRSYRHIEYSTHFSKFGDAHKRVADLAEKIANGQIAFGSPISDFLGNSGRAVPLVNAENASHEQESELVPEESDGFVDAMINFEEGLNELSSLVSQFSDHVAEIGSETTNATPELVKASNEGKLKEARAILRDLSREYDAHATELSTINRAFESRLNAISNSYEIILDFARYSNQEEPEGPSELLASMRSMANQSKSAKSSIEILIDTMRGVPKMERSFDRSKRRIIEELVAYAESIDLVSAMVSRADDIADEV